MIHHKLGIHKQQRITESITDVSIDWLTGYVRVLPSDNHEIRIVQLTDGKFSEAKLFQYEVIDGRLSIVDGRKRAFKLGFHVNHTALEVYLPKVQLQSLMLITAGGHLEIRHLHIIFCRCRITSGSVKLSGTIDELELHTVGSPVNGESLICRKLHLRSTSSKINLSGSYSELDAQTSGRGLALSSSTMLTRIRSVSTAGSVVISIPENDGFKIRLKKWSGQYKNDFPMEKVHDSLVYKEGGNSFEAEIRGGSFAIQRV